MSQIDIDPNLTVDEVMRRWPATIGVFIRHRMGCIGCSIAPFHSIEDSSVEHDIPVALLMAELMAAINDGRAETPSPRRSASGHADPG